jgi:hypothetical protein
MKEPTNNSSNEYVALCRLRLTLRNALTDVEIALGENPEMAVTSEGVRQSYLKACEISLASGLLGDGDRSDLLELYESLWPRAPTDIRAESLRVLVKEAPPSQERQCSWGCHYQADGRLNRNPACTVHGASQDG